VAGATAWVGPVLIESLTSPAGAASGVFSGCSWTYVFFTKPRDSTVYYTDFSNGGGCDTGAANNGSPDPICVTCGGVSYSMSNLWGGGVTPAAAWPVARDVLRQRPQPTPAAAAARISPRTANDHCKERRHCPCRVLAPVGHAVAFMRELSHQHHGLLAAGSSARGRHQYRGGIWSASSHTGSAPAAAESVAASNAQELNGPGEAAPASAPELRSGARGPL
jgi:hypothetical protein